MENHRTQGGGALPGRADSGRLQAGTQLEDSFLRGEAFLQPRKKTTGPRLPLPIGISDYRLASSRYYYIDKTMMIKEFLDERPMVSLFTRPRRFGKTLNMDMLRTFFEKTAEDTSVYFKDKKYGSAGKITAIIKENIR